MPINDTPRAFLSYSHADKVLASKIEEDLRRAGIDVWFDKWEIQPGDSLVERIFLQGLANAQFFLVLLTRSSAESRWVREELSSAMIKRIEGVIRVIPVIGESCDIPLPLRALAWVDLSAGYEDGIRQLIKVVHGVSEKPLVGEPPEYVSALRRSVKGLSREASTVGILLLSRPDDGTGFEKSYSAEELHSLLPALTEAELNDAIDELKSYGLVEVLEWFGTAPFDFGQVSPTYALFLHFKDEGLAYDPEDDIRAVISAVAAKGTAGGPELQSLLHMPPVRVNRAVSYLEDYGYARVIKTLGTAPFDFSDVQATRRTRELARANV